MIEIKSLTKTFGDKTIIDDLSLVVEKGEIVTILGESGTGKSVLAKHIVGLLKPDQGEVFIEEQNVVKLSEKDLLELRKEMGYLFQEGALYDFMDVYDNIAFPLKEHTDLSEDQIRIKVQNMLMTVDLEGVENKFPSELSGGMLKRVGLARAMILDCKILICDEPTSGLDPIRSRDISVLIQKVARKQNATAFVISHDLKNSLRISDRLILFRNGKIVMDGKPDEFIQSTNPYVRSFIDQQKD